MTSILLLQPGISLLSYLRAGEQVRGSKATRTTPRPWENSTKGSRNPSKSDLCVERKTSGEPCSRDSQKEVLTIKHSQTPAPPSPRAALGGWGRGPLHIS